MGHPPGTLPGDGNPNPPTPVYKLYYIDSDEYVDMTADEIALYQRLKGVYINEVTTVTELFDAMAKCLIKFKRDLTRVSKC